MRKLRIILLVLLLIVLGAVSALITLRLSSGGTQEPAKQETAISTEPADEEDPAVVTAAETREPASEAAPGNEPAEPASEANTGNDTVEPASEAGPAPLDPAAWQAAYREVLQGGAPQFDLGEIREYALYDLNKDGTPELFVSHGGATYKYDVIDFIQYIPGSNTVEAFDSMERGYADLFGSSQANVLYYTFQARNWESVTKRTYAAGESPFALSLEEALYGKSVDAGEDYTAFTVFQWHTPDQREYLADWTGDDVKNNDELLSE